MTQEQNTASQGHTPQNPANGTEQNPSEQNQGGQKKTGRFTHYKTPIKRPYMGMLYGSPGVGKTTLAASIPNAIIIDLEWGADGYTCDYIKLDPMDSPAEIIEEIQRAVAYAVKQGFTTIVIDSLTTLCGHFEKLFLLQAGKLSPDAEYGRDYDKINSLVKTFLGDQQSKTGLFPRLKAHNCSLLLISHQKDMVDSVGTSNLLYSTVPQLYKGMREWVYKQMDFIFFYTFDILIKEDQLGMTKEKLSATRGRKLITTQEGGILAKNRFGLKPSISNPKADVFTAIFDGSKKIGSMDGFGRTDQRD